MSSYSAFPFAKGESMGFGHVCLWARHRLHEAILTDQQLRHEREVCLAEELLKKEEEKGAFLLGRTRVLYD